MVYRLLSSWVSDLVRAIVRCEQKQSEVMLGRFPSLIDTLQIFNGVSIEPKKLMKWNCFVSESILLNVIFLDGRSFFDIIGRGRL